MKCSNCRTIHPLATKQRKRGTRYVILANCRKCGRGVHIEGVAGVTPPRTITNQ